MIMNDRFVPSRYYAYTTVVIYIPVDTDVPA